MHATNSHVYTCMVCLIIISKSKHSREQFHSRTERVQPILRLRSFAVDCSQQLIDSGCKSSELILSVQVTSRTRSVSCLRIAANLSSSTLIKVSNLQRPFGGRDFPGNSFGAKLPILLCMIQAVNKHTKVCIYRCTNRSTTFPLARGFRW